MDDVCTACLCSGRNLYFITETGFYDTYSNILNEIPVYDVTEICVRICWECRAVLHRFHVFKQRVKQSHIELMHHFSQKIPPNFLPTNPPNLQIHLQHITSYPEVKLEPMDFKDPTRVDLVVKDEGASENETDDTHCEPETFVRVLDIRSDKKIQKKQTRKTNNKPRKARTEKERPPKKKKTKITNEVLKIDETNTSDIDNSENVDNCDVEDYKEEKVVEEKIGKEQLEIKVFVCQDCNSGFDNIDELERHKKVNHVQVKIVKVKPMSVRLPVINGTLKRARVKEDLPDKPKCVECDKQFSSKKTYRYHRNVIHRGQNQHPCPRCDKVFQWRSNLGRHMRSHTARDLGELNCELCDKKFASVATYRQHLKLSKKHVDETQFSFMCNECGRKFVTKTRLRDHIDWEHLQKVKFRCQLCNKPFKCHTSLYVHRRAVHPAADEKRGHLCHVCGKCYTNPNKLKYHIVAMHTHETPYKCTLCDTAFRWYSSLYRHTKEVHYKMRLQPNRYKGKKPRKEQGPPEN